MSQFASVLSQVFPGLVPILAAALGGLATEYVGVLNIALEGLIMAGGFSYVAVGSAWGPEAGFVAALAVPAAIAWLQDLYARKARADAFVVGLSINLLVPGLASLLSQLLFGTKGVVADPSLASARLPRLLPGLPVLGPLLGAQRLSDWLALSVAVLAASVLAWTPFGLRARAAGMNPESLELAGVRPGRIRGQAYLLSGLACGASGAALAAAIGAWVPNLSAGRGWIALVAVYLGAKRLGGTLLASLAFALLLALANAAQALHSLPADLIAAAPFAVTAVVVVAGAFLRRAKRPAVPAGGGNRAGRPPA